MTAVAERTESLSPAEILPASKLHQYLPMEPAARHGNEEADVLAPAAFLHALRRQWLLGGLIGLCLGAAVAVPLWILQPSNYTSTAYLRVSSRTAPLIFETADSRGRADFGTYVSTQRQLILTPFVLEGALRDESVAALPLIKGQVNPVEWLQSKLKITAEAEVMKVSLTTSDQNAAKQIVDGVVNAYLREVVLTEENERRSRLENLERVYADAESKLRTKLAGLRSLADNLGTSDSESLSLAQQGAVQQWGLVRNALTNLQFDLMKAEGELKYQQQNTPEADEAGAEGEVPAQSTKSLALDAAIEVDATALGHIREIKRLRDSIAEVQRRLTPEAAAPYIKTYEAQLATAEQHFAERRAVLEERLQQTAPVEAGGVDGLTYKVNILKNQEQQLSAEVEKLETEAKKFGRSSIDVEMMRAEIESLDGVLARIGQEIEHTKIELRSGSRTTMLSPATVPTSTELKKRAAIAGFGGIAGFCLPIALLVWRDASRRRVDNPKAVADSLRLNVLGVIPRVPYRTMKRIGNRSSSAGRWRERLAESINAVTAMLLRKAMQEERRIILVSSAVAGEGKTTLAGQLAARLAALGHRTLLIDFDLRRPTLHHAFDVPLGPGVGEVLDQTVTLAEAIQPSARPELFLLAAGDREPNVLEAASSGELRKLFGTLRTEFEFVIVDSSPILPVVDARLVGQFADGVILSVLTDVSEAPKVSAALDILKSYGASMIGTVVTGGSGDVYYGDYGGRRPAGVMS